MTIKQKQALELRAQGLTYGQIGVRMGCNTSDAYRLVSNAVHNTRKTSCIYPNIRNRMNELCMTNRALAKAAGCTEFSISNYLRGKHMPDIQIARGIAQALDMTIDEAFKTE